MMSPGLLSRRVPDRCLPARLQLSDQAPFKKAGTLAALLGVVVVQVLCQLGKCVQRGGKLDKKVRFCLENSQLLPIVVIFWAGLGQFPSP
jgi:hypothetical protein